MHNTYNKITLIFLIALLSFSAQAKLPDFITNTVKTSAVIPGRITITIPDIAENGSVVPISIKQITTEHTGVHAVELWFFADSSKILLAHYILSDKTSAAGIGLRVKLAKSSMVYAVARLSDGRYVSGEKYVKVTIGGCGGGGGESYSGSVVYPRMNTGYRYTPPNQVPHANEKYATIANNGVVVCANNPLSTFSVDVDTGSYTNVRRFILSHGQVPPAGAVRTEEMINYFNYDYTPPRSRDIPFAIHTEAGPSPWNKQTRLLRIGLKGYEVDTKELPPSNLVFLLDVSGSMGDDDKLPLLIRSLKLLTGQLRKQDRVAIVVYAGASGVVLPVTSGDQHDTIVRALDKLEAGGSTNGGEGIHLAYVLAKEGFIKGGTNRVILATDGDFNVGTTNHNELINLVKKYREMGVSLTTLGFGRGNYNDHLMEQLADHGNGNHAYIDSFAEAQKVLLEQMSGTLHTIAKDVKIQVEFNPALVAEYRLVGYENRLLRNEDFRNDKVDAGDIGAGHTVTAVYELTLTDSEFRYVPKLKYTAQKDLKSDTDEIATVKLRFKQPDGNTSRKVERIIRKSAIKTRLSETSSDFRFAAAVAGFGQWLRQDNMIKPYDTRDIVTLADGARGKDRKGYRAEFIRMVETAGRLQQVN
ncbi:MAG: von Willebrand factor type A domain-containing protein [Gammaproteobacteria bacterium]|nr:von Willebrand factor type A domain-containing protein [Gammaproteobacteria bacterium]